MPPEYYIEHRTVALLSDCPTYRLIEFGKLGSDFTQQEVVLHLQISILITSRLAISQRVIANLLRPHSSTPATTPGNIGCFLRLGLATSDSSAAYCAMTACLR